MNYLQVVQVFVRTSTFVNSVEPDLHEWNYGVYEGRKTADIRKEIADWSVWHSPIPEGKNLADVGRCAQGVIDRLLETARQTGARCA